MANSKSASNYKSLISNTVIFGVSTFGSKALTLILTRLYTELLSPDAIGLAELVTTACNLILPVMYLGIAESVIRFGLEKSYKRSDIFSVALFTVAIGWGVLWCFSPLLNQIPNLKGYPWLICVYCLASAMRTVVTGFVRSSGLVRMFAIDGIVTTASTLGFNLLFMLGFRMGAVGYVLGTVMADALSALSLIVLLRLHRFIRFRGIDMDTVRDMFRYALPLIPTAIFWWITNASDKFFVQAMVGLAATGVYSMAQRIPNLIMQVSAFFTRAWELSAFTEYNSEDGERFFSNVFRSYYTFVFVLASVLILLIKPFTRALLNVQYYEAWRYSLFLILGVSFSCLVTFLGAIYNAARKNAMITVTTFIGAGLNIWLNWLLIPRFGPTGAALATFASYLVVFLIRAVDTRRYVRIRMQPWRIALSLAILSAQTAVMLAEPKLWVLWECLLVALLFLCNFGYLLFLARRVLALLQRKRKAR